METTDDHIAGNLTTRVISKRTRVIKGAASSNSTLGTPFLRDITQS